MCKFKPRSGHILKSQRSRGNAVSSVLRVTRHSQHLIATSNHRHERELNVSHSFPGPSSVLPLSLLRAQQTHGPCPGGRTWPAEAVLGDASPERRQVRSQERGPHQPDAWAIKFPDPSSSPGQQRE